MGIGVLPCQTCSHSRGKDRCGGLKHRGQFEGWQDTGSLPKTSYIVSDRKGTVRPVLEAVWLCQHDKLTYWRSRFVRWDSTALALLCSFQTPREL